MGQPVLFSWLFFFLWNLGQGTWLRFRWCPRDDKDITSWAPYRIWWWKSNDQNMMAWEKGPSKYRTRLHHKRDFFSSLSPKKHRRLFQPIFSALKSAIAGCVPFLKAWTVFKELGVMRSLFQNRKESPFGGWNHRTVKRRWSLCRRRKTVLQIESYVYVTRILSLFPPRSLSLV